MKKGFCLLLILLCLCSAYASAEGGLKVTDKNLIELDANDIGYFFARVENTGDAPVTVGNGKLVGFSADDEILISENYVSTYPGYVELQPGEYAYVKEYIWESALNAQDVADYKFSMETSDYGKESTRLPCEAMFDYQGPDSYDNYIYVTFTNPEDSILYGCYVSVALYDQENTLLFVDGNSFDSLGVHPGSTVTLKLYIDSGLAKYYSAHALTPTKADAMVFYFNED